MANHQTDWINPTGGTIVQEGPVRFGSIEFGANLGICRKLGIKRLPTVHFYQQGQKLTGFTCGPSKFPLLVHTLQDYLQQQEQQSQEHEEALSHVLEQGTQLIQQTTIMSRTNSINNNQQQQNKDMETTMMEPNMEMTTVLEELMEQDANGELESAKTTPNFNKRKNKKKWWNILP